MGLITESTVTVLEAFGTFSQKLLGLQPAVSAPLLGIASAALITGYYTDYNNLRESLELDWSDAVLGLIVFSSLVSIYYASPNPARLLIDNWTLAVLVPVFALLVRNWTGVKTN